MNIPRYSTEEKLAKINEIVAAGIANGRELGDRLFNIEFEEALDTTLEDEKFMLYASAVMSLLRQYVPGVDKLTQDEAFSLMLRFSTLLSLFKEDILNKLGVEE